MPANLLALAAIALPGDVPSRGGPTPAENQAVVEAILPHALTVLTAKCRPSLPADAYLARNGDRLAAQLQPQADAAMPLALRVVSGVRRDVAPVGSDADRRAQLFKSFDQNVLGSIRVADCPEVSDVLEPLDPLPPANLARFIARLIGNRLSVNFAIGSHPPSAPGEGG